MHTHTHTPLSLTPFLPLTPPSHSLSHTHPQEALVTDLRASGVEQNHEITRGKESIQSLQLQSEMLKRQVNEAHERLDESSKVITSNQEVS